MTSNKAYNYINVAEVRKRALTEPFSIGADGRICLTGDQSRVARLARSQEEVNRTLWQKRRETLPAPVASDSDADDDDEKTPTDVHPASLT